MDINIDSLTDEQKELINSYRRINGRLETLQKQMEGIQTETSRLLEELAELRNKENKKLNNGKK